MYCMVDRVVGEAAVIENRKNRLFMASDEEWRMIQQRAADEGLSVSEYIRVFLLNHKIFVITESRTLKNPKTITLEFTNLGNGCIACDSMKHQKALEAFAGLDGIVYANSTLFDNYVLVTDDGRQVVYKERIRE